MSKTALDLTPEERQNYRPGREWDEKAIMDRWQHAWDVARAGARVLREKFGARRVVVFGSLANRTCFTPWSDIDIGAWGIPANQFYRAVAAVTGISSECDVDLVDPENCLPSLRQKIERDGIDL